MSESATRPGLRRAALALHALGKSDRRWLMERLPASQRTRLLALLDELDAMGVRFDAADVARVAAPPPAPASTAGNWRRTLPGEPDWVIAALAGDGPAMTEAARAALAACAQRRAGREAA